MTSYGYHFTFSAKGAEITLHGEGFSSKEEADLALAVALKLSRYTAPKFWQISRWGEMKPNKDVVARLAESAG